ncbi:hypothetical protein HY345_01565 [Candidatus Microgenomates bacterium]|nr:hypothetical protein [Candidatus Microgenomates bacterium]
MSETRDILLKGGMLLSVLGGTVTLEACKNVHSEYTLSQVKDQDKFNKDLHDYFFSDVPLTFLDMGRSTPTPTPKQLEGRENMRKVVDILGQGTRNIIFYRRENTTLVFYLPEDAPVFTQEQLDESWNFLKERNQGAGRFGPARDVRLYVGRFGDIISQTHSPFITPSGLSFSMGFINLEDEKYSSNPQTVELCQNLLIRSFGNLFEAFQNQGKGETQETECNTFGIAAYAAGQGMDYEQYQKVGNTRRYLDQQPIQLQAYPPETYEKIRSIFAPKATPASSPSSKMSRKDIVIYNAAAFAWLQKLKRSLSSLKPHELAKISETIDYLTAVNNKNPFTGKNKQEAANDLAIWQVNSGAMVST